MQMSEQINELASALAKAQGKIQPAVKDATNLGFKNQQGKPSKYADLAAVWDACRAPLAENGLSVVQLPTTAEPGHIALTSMLLHSSGQYIATTTHMRLMQDTPHGAGSALTYLRRYALAALVGIVADDDDDGNAASGVRPSNGNASYSAPAERQQRIAPPQPAGPVPVCESHKTDMRWGKNGGWICPTKLPDGSWCRGRTLKPPADDAAEWDAIDAAAAQRGR